ncbi:hypothetical protein ACFHW2_17455 [Actinomadura sp. LOL_016]
MPYRGKPAVVMGAAALMLSLGACTGQVGAKPASAGTTWTASTGRS